MQDIRFTPEQMQELSQWEENMGTAVRSNWARGIGRTATLRMNEIYNEATGCTTRVNVTCGGCVLTLLRDVGKVYFRTKGPLKTQGNGKKRTKRTAKENGKE